MKLIEIITIHGWTDYGIILLGYILLLSTSGKVINAVLNSITNKSLEEAASNDKPTVDDKKRRLAAGSIIGKCENIIILSFVLMEAYTAVAIVLTAKTLVRKEEIEKNEMYFLVGTLVNVSYSVVVSFIVRQLIVVLPI